jgi:hypothetical protein
MRAATQDGKLTMFPASALMFWTWAFISSHPVKASWQPAQKRFSDRALSKIWLFRVLVLEARQEI